jgi:membrane-bound metal-dependent hydrolase YbcI (DUF457 family)
VAILASPLLPRGWRTPRIIGWTALAAAAPDVDAIGRPFGYADLAIFGGHRALTHSMCTGLLFGLLVFLIVRRGSAARSASRLALYVTVVVASHGLLDALTTYGEGVAFFAPFTMHRWKSGWQPFDGLVAEIVALWLPGALTYALWLRPQLARARSSITMQPNVR